MSSRTSSLSVVGWPGRRSRGRATDDQGASTQNQCTGTNKEDSEADGGGLGVFKDEVQRYLDRVALAWWGDLGVVDDDFEVWIERRKRACHHRAPPLRWRAPRTRRS